MKKKTIFVLSDHPMSPSGVGIQTRYMIEGLLKTGKYRFVCLGGAVKHHDYKTQSVEPWGEDFLVHPIDGYGNAQVVRSVIRKEKPDLMWFMTDPRFWGWLWEIEDEVRPMMPMVYYHVWDNFPYPKYNKAHYDSNDLVVTISKVTDEIVKNVAPDVESIYHPHTVDTNVFKPLQEAEEVEFKNQFFKSNKDKVVFFWNNRNARRKQSGTLIYWFKEFLDKIGRDKAALIMHTDVKDPHGQDLEVIIRELGVTNGEVMFSTQKLPPEHLAKIYSTVDCTINISDAEGFGLATLESLACGTPIIVNMTGGLQEQVTDGEEWFGIGLEPKAKAVIGSQEIPYIYEDRIIKEDFIDALTKIYEMSKEERKELGEKGRQHVLNNYGFEQYQEGWVKIIDDTIEKYGSWDTRKHYNHWTISEI